MLCDDFLNFLYLTGRPQANAYLPAYYAHRLWNTSTRLKPPNPFGIVRVPLIFQVIAKLGQRKEIFESRRLQVVDATHT
jgi:hypothetical protein